MAGGPPLAGPGPAGPAPADAGVTGQDMPGSALVDPDRPGPALPGPTRLRGAATASPVAQQRPGRVRLGLAVLGPVLQGILRRVGRRLLSSVPALLGVVVVTFVLMRVLPGDPAVFFASGPSAGQAEIERLRHEMGLDRPIPIQLLRYFGDLARGNLGRSLTTGQPVVVDMARRLPASLELTLSALALALLLAVPLGVAAALRPGSAVDHAVRLLCTLGVCVPTFVSGLLLIYVFYYLLGWAPDPTARLDIFAATPPDITGFYLIDFALVGNWDGWWAAFTQLLLPATSMALFVLAPLARMTRASMLAVLGGDFVRTARAMGLARWRIIVVTALRNALLPVLTITGIVFSTMLGGNVLVEKVFSWPGVASYALDALLAADYAPVQAFVLLMAGIFVLVNVLIDILYGIADPRVSLE
jgi:peptide/nickel transport system permease protein